MPSEVMPNTHAGVVYSAAVGYLILAGWRRQEKGSGWWWKEGFDDCTTGTALEEQMHSDGLDLRASIDGEPEEYWG